MGTRGFADFDSRKKIMDEIVAALKDNKIDAIGICGLGGMGKTTTVKEVRKRAKVEKLFDEIVMATVTQTPNFIGIQDEIAEKLGLELKEKSLRGRAEKLWGRLLQCKSILVILDDVWKTFNLEEIGIPFRGNHKGCKLMMTSRSQEVCNAMGTRELFTIGALSEQEAWSFFKDKAGNSIDSGNLRQIAIEVVKECGGLPIAIITVGTALKNKLDEALWNNALLQLRQSSPENILEMNEKVYRSLELSFNFLESQEAKSCLLLCCIFKEDANIPMQDLVRYGVGLGLFKGIEEMVQATDRVYTLVHKLKSCYLLLDSELEECVKMHDVVWDVIISIAITGKEDLVLRHGLEAKEWPTGSTGDESYTTTSLIYHKIQQLLLLDIKGSKDVPNVITLRRFCAINNFDTVPYVMISDSKNVPDNLFEGMKEPRVLELRRMLVPSSLSLLTNLQTLCLQNCLMENVSLIGELKMLRILSFRGSFIRELPRKIGELIHLQCLDLTDCHHLERISPEVLSSLIRLEQLYMRYCYNVQWEVDDEGTSERNNANLAEFKSLSDHLTTLEIDLPSSAKILGGFKKLVRFSIYIGNKPLDSYMGGIKRSGNELIMKLDSGIPIESWINEVLKKTETLDFQVCGVKNVVKNVNQERYVQLKSLEISNCDVLECVIDKVDLVQQSIFPVLETLYIDVVENLKMICHCPLPAGSFVKLRSIKLFECKRLENVFSESIARGLVQLEELEICDCDMMEEIVVMERGAEEQVITSKIRFPKLGKLSFIKLASLVGFSKKMGEIEFPQLSELYLEGLPELRSLCPSSSVANSEGKYEYEESATQHLFNQKIMSLCELRCITVEHCERLVNIFSSNSIQSLHNLVKVEIVRCKSVEVVFDFMGVNIEEGLAALPLSRLKVVLRCLPMLTCVWKRPPQQIQDVGSVPIDLSNGKIKSLCELRSITVERCEKLVNIFSSNLIQSLQNLEEVEITECDSVEVVFDFMGVNIEEGLVALPLSRLKKLYLKDLPKLLYVWKKLPQRIQNCQNLESLEIVRCSALKNMFSPSTAKIAEQLEELCVDGCEMMTEIVAEDKEDDKAMDKIEFLQLRRLTLSELPKLLSFFPKDSNFRGTNNPDALDVRSIEIHLFNEKVSFPRLEILYVNNMENIGEIWCSQLPSYSFCELRVLEVSNCDKILQVAPFHLLTRLHNLEEVLVSECNSLEEVFEFKCPNVEEGRAVMLPRSLKHMSLNSLKILRVLNCAKLRNLFNPSMIRGLVHLQDLSIHKCVMMEEIVAKGEEKEEGTMDKIVLPQLKTLMLYCLPNLTSFCQGLYAFDLPLLDDLRVEGCLKMRKFSLGFANTPKLKQVKLELYFEGDLMGDLNNTIQQLFQRRQVHLDLQNLKQGDKSVTTYLQEAKVLVDALHAAGRPLSLADLNMYVLRGLRSDFKDLVTTIIARPEPTTFAELHSLLTSHEFIHSDSMTKLTFSFPTDVPPSAHRAQRSSSSFSNRGRGRFSRFRRGRGRGNFFHHRNAGSQNDCSGLEENQCRQETSYQAHCQMFGDSDEIESSFEGSLHLEELFANCSELEEIQCRPETSYQAHCQDLEVNRETVPEENEAQRDQSPERKKSYSV